MKINARTHLEIRLQNLAFLCLFLTITGLLGWLSTRYVAEFDWTAGNRNTLSEASRKVVDLLDSPVNITVFAREEKVLRDRIKDQLERYQRYNKSVTCRFINPDTQPTQVREQGITVDGELLLEYHGHSEKVQEANESGITNALQRLLQGGERRLVFLEGHGERSPRNKGDADMGQFGDEMTRKGITASTLNLAQTPAIPENTSALVLASPRVRLMSGEVRLIQDYLNKGGNLLWLQDAGDAHGLEPLLQQFGLKLLPGVIVDPSAQLFGINDPTFVMVTEYPPHPAMRGFSIMTLFPMASALETSGKTDFQPTPILSTLRHAWTETGSLKETKLQFDADKGERQGPLVIGFALARARPASQANNADSTAENTAPPQEQRIAVIGDGDFLANSYLGEGGNLNLGVNLVNWLTQDDRFINIPPLTATDRALNLSPIASIAIAIVFLILLPLLFFVSGAVIWFKRRKR
ncbi:GldG family protein [Candidatus Methylospira mobilis]|uniref:GldG family protein n=1 Tax=Candidatus Methylospira mobilis TaxID=1808979 RepID=UPI0028E3B429|nr:GldG family protein [Candidatus Methylospira mobilis]WNV06171.1 GldG family protein [Candidatus Methylospira mobilis]